ncbi:MAG: THUMP domain-containing class I SAM-dependent RNA methyltransferase [Rhabdochlamydiaceae bacterium]
MKHTVRKKELFVSCPSQLESILIEELQSLDIPINRKGCRGVYVPFSMEAVYKINYLSRIATRVLYPLIDFCCRDKEDLYKNSRDFDWLNYLNPEKTFAIDANVSHKNLKHSLHAALVVKDGICDFFREKLNIRPSVNTSNPDIQLNLFIHNDRAVISLDTSGAPLYKRGYRLDTVPAPVQENMAAALLYLASYESNMVFADPFCGSGTFLIEAAMQATKTPAGFYRHSFGFLNMPEFSQSDWDRFKKEWDKKRSPLKKQMIYGSDISEKAIEASYKNLERAHFVNEVPVFVQDVKDYKQTPDLIISNPPYGKRLDKLDSLYQDLDKLLEKTKAHIYMLAPLSQRRLPFRVKRIVSLMNGGLPVDFFKISKN